VSQLTISALRMGIHVTFSKQISVLRNPQVSTQLAIAEESGFLLGILVLKCGNPFLALIVAGVLLVNGGTGLVKVALLRFFKISIFKNIRFPLHDHVRKNMNWSTPQVLVRFSLIQMALTLTLMVLLLKLR
jgi:phospho-N-acetylmuramoyl-pentapeptide-transferase